MRRFDTQTLETDLHRLDLRFAALRMRQPRVVERLARSIEHNGQLVPVVAVAEQTHRWVLIDGYLRIEALRLLSRDTAWVERWDCPLSQALLMVLVRVQARPWEAIEEGALIRELMQRFELSQREVARQTGRDVSWVSRRLSLVQDLPEALFVAICRGELSPWAATRVLAPLARANTDHAERLLSALQREPLTTRELHTWYQHYQKANRLKRERLLTQPRLFCQALQAQTRAQAAADLRAGPEGAWLAGLKRLTQHLRALHKQVPLVLTQGLETTSLQPAWAEMKTVVQDLDQTLAKVTPHDRPGDTSRDCRPAPPGHPHPQDRPAAEGLAQQCAPGDTPAAATPRRGGGGDANAPAGTDHRGLCAL
jgi:ParB-like chromosome segregation protein Spo0J